MKFITTQSALFAALKLVKAAVPSRPVHPILSNILIQIEKNSLTLTAHDLAVVGIRTKIDVESKDSGVFAASAQMLLDIVSRLPEGELAIEVLEKHAFTIKSPKGKYKLHWLDATEYPDFPVVEPLMEERSLVLDSGIFTSAIKSVAFSVATDETKQVLVGIHFRVQDKCIELSATDGHRLSVARFEHEYQGEPIEVTIPASSLIELERVAPEGELKLTLSDRLAQFEAGNHIIVTRILEGMYPPYEQLIPTQFRTTAVVDRKELISALERLAVLGEKDKGKVKGGSIQFDIEKELVGLSVSATDLGDGEEEIEGLMTGELVSLLLSAKYTLDALRVIGTSEVQFSIHTPTTPIIVEPARAGVNGSKQTYLLMPLRKGDQG